VRDFDIHSENDSVTIPVARLGERIGIFSDTEIQSNSDLAKLYAKTKPAVVQLYTKDHEPHGSGFFIEADGKISTAYHCVQFQDSMKVITADNKTYIAKVVSVKPSLDIAYLQVEAPAGDKLNFPALKFREKTSDLREGDSLAAFGHPHESPQVYIAPGKFVSSRPANEMGYVPIETSGRNNLLPLIEARMHVEPGNSGGPVVDKNGEVVGITSSGNSGTDQIIPVETIRQSLGLTSAPSYASFLPHQLHWGTQATVLSSEVAVVGLTKMAGYAKSARLGAAVLGAAELCFHDLTPLAAAYYSGTKAEKVSETINVLGDGLMIGAIVIGSHGKGVATALTGLGLKLANNVSARRRFW